MREPFVGFLLTRAGVVPPNVGSVRYEELGCVYVYPDEGFPYCPIALTFREMRVWGIFLFFSYRIRKLFYC